MGGFHAPLAGSVQEVAARAALLFFFFFNLVGCSHRSVAPPENDSTPKSIRITAIYQGSPAEAAGLSENDIILRYNNLKVESVNHLRDLLKVSRPGDVAGLRVLRGEDGYASESEYQVALAEWPKPLPPLKEMKPRALPSQMPITKNWCGEDPAHFERRSMPLKKTLRLTYYIYCDSGKELAVSGAVVRRDSARGMLAAAASPDSSETPRCRPSEAGHPAAWLGALICDIPSANLPYAGIERFQAPLFTVGGEGNRLLSVAPRTLALRDNEDIDLVVPFEPELSQVEDPKYWLEALENIRKLRRR